MSRFRSGSKNSWNIWRRIPSLPRWDVLSGSLMRRAAGLAGVTKLTIAVALCIIGILFRFVPWIGTVVTVTLATLAFIVQYSGYCSLRNSLAIGTEGQRGAANLKTSMILLVIGALTILIPEYGLTISAFISMISIWLLYLGWKRIMFGIETSAEGIEEMY